MQKFRLKVACFGLLMLSLSQTQLIQAGSLFSLKGTFIQGGLVVGTTEVGSKVSLNERQLRVSSDGHFVFGLDRDAKSGDKLLVESPEGLRVEKVLTVEPREYKIQRIEGIAKRIMQPSDANLKRSREENGQVGVARKKDLNLASFNESFQWPAQGSITGVFGSQRVYNGEPRRPHYGVDVAGPVGTLVTAPASGIVTLAHKDMFYSGGTLILDHGHGLSSSFLHLSEILVKVGDVIKQGQPIAKIGATGRVTGAHLDWRMNWFKRRIDPQLLVPAMPVQGDE